MRRRRPIEILWCQNRTARHPRRAGWSFPMEIEAKIRELACDGSVIHFFGGAAKFGVRMDIDPATAPDIVGDAWLPPLAKASFDTVVLDPPYLSLPREELFQLLYAASYVARKQVIWLHQIWSPSGAGLSLERGWLVRCGDSLVVRCLQLFQKNGKPIYPMVRFTRGPAMKYNRWLAGEMALPFGAMAETSRSQESLQIAIEEIA
jgi:hypothetical protein